MDVSRIIQDHEWITVLVSEVISVVIVKCIRLSAHIFFRPSFKTINSIDQNLSLLHPRFFLCRVAAQLLSLA